MLVRIGLKNFKSFHEAVIPLGSFSLLIGSNGAGKSNLFDALRFLHFVGRGSSIRDAIEGHAAPGSFSVTVPGIRGGGRGITYQGSQSREFELSLKLRTVREVIDYMIRVDSEKYRVVAESLSSNRHPGPYVFSTHPDVAPLEHKPDSPALLARFYKNTRGVNPRREFTPYESILSQFSGRAAESLVNERVAGAVRQELSAIRPLELRPEILREYSSLGQFELGEHGENFAALVWRLKEEVDWIDDENEVAVEDEQHDARKRLAAIVEWLSELTPHSIRDVEVEEAPTGEVIFALREEPFGEPMTARSLSDGTLRFSALTFAVLGSGARRTLLIEELENGINPARLALLVKMLEQATETRPGVQILATTHAPAVLDFAGPKVLGASVLIYWDEDSACSRAKRLVEIPGFDEVHQRASVGELQAEGWFQFAASSR